MGRQPCSDLWEYEFDGDALPRAGSLTVVLSGAGEPICLIETVQVTIRRFDEVDAGFAERMPLVCERFRKV